MSSYLGFRLFFFIFLSWPITRKQLIFKVWFRGLIFFNFLSDCLFTFFYFGPFFGPFFWKNSLSEHISCTRSPQNFTRPEENISTNQREENVDGTDPNWLLKIYKAFAKFACVYIICTVQPLTSSLCKSVCVCVCARALAWAHSHACVLSRACSHACALAHALSRACEHICVSMWVCMCLSVHMIVCARVWEQERACVSMCVSMHGFTIILFISTYKKCPF